ncbi:hypothetical protein PAB09_09645 [Corynebacterium sp. SCR221107]|uniref:hypothetical protein n=1 Tax=Corynebacterium sp. SCR221107 TaxID=3017361 RepID=UPI0022EC2C95|nr:hypothetical protein [Corynebacterium sp. SCR221107]WBT08152.1 hypothetical protein PAB09_09645 [Corynebacterium sp. SCR221107]
MPEPIVGIVDAVGQFLTSAPLWLQAPIVMVVMIPLCGVLAVVWLRVVDVAGAVLVRAFRPHGARVGGNAHEPTGGGEQEKTNS